MIVITTNNSTNVKPAPLSVETLGRLGREHIINLPLLELSQLLKSANLAIDYTISLQIGTAWLRVRRTPICGPQKRCVLRIAVRLRPNEQTVWPSPWRVPPIS